MSNDDRTSNGNVEGFHHDEMDEFIDRLIDGSLPAGKEFSPLENALIEMSAFSAPEIEVGGSSVVERMSEEMEAEILSPVGHNKHAYITRLLGVKVIIALTTAAAFTGASAAAASGSLPEPIQKAFSAAVSNLGVSLPSSPVTTTTTNAAAPSQSQIDNFSKSQGSSTTTAVTNLAIGSGTPVPPNSASTEEPSSPNCLPLLAQSISSSLSLTTSSSTSTSPTTTSPTTTTSSTTTTTEPPTTTTGANKCVPTTTSPTTTTSSTTTTTQTPTTTTTQTPTTTTTQTPTTTTQSTAAGTSASILENLGP